MVPRFNRNESFYADLDIISDINRFDILMQMYVPMSYLHCGFPRSGFFNNTCSSSVLYRFNACAFSGVKWRGWW